MDTARMSALQVTNRPSWLAWRRGGLGASDAAAIAGLDPYRGPMSVWLDKSGRLPLDEAEQSEYMHWGQLLEPAIADQFEQRTGLFAPAQSRALMLEHKSLPWMRATIDGLVAERLDVSTFQDREPQQIAGEILGVLEIKTVAGFKSSAWADGAVPEHFQLQVAHQLAVTGLAHAWIAVLFGGQRLEIVELDRDDELIESLIQLEETFWKKCVLGDEPPAGDGSAAGSDDLRRAFAGAGGAEVDLPADVEELIEQREQSKAVLKAAERSCAEAEQGLMALLQDAEVGLLGGRPRVTWKRHERAVVDLDGMRAKHPELVAQFTSKSGYRVLRLVGAKEES